MDLYVRLNADAAIRLAGGRIEFGGGQPQARVGALKLENALHGSLAETSHADDFAAVMFANRPGEYLRGTGALLVDNQRQRHAPLLLLVGGVGTVFLGDAAVRADDHALREKK